MKEKYGLLWGTEIEGYLNEIYLSSEGDVISFLDGEIVDKIVVINKKSKPRWEYEINNMTYGSMAPISDMFSVSSNHSFMAAITNSSIYFFNIERGFLWKYETGLKTNITDYYREVVVSSNGSYILASFNDPNKPIKIIYYLNKEGDLLWKYETNKTIPEIMISSNGSYIATVFSSLNLKNKYEVSLFDKEGKLHWNIPWTPSSLNISGNEKETWIFKKLSISFDGTYIVTTYQKGEHVSNGSEINLINNVGQLLWKKEIPDEINDIAVSDDGSIVVNGGIYKRELDKATDIVYFIDREGNIIKKFENDMNLVSISNDGSFMVKVSDNNNISLLDNKGEILWKYEINNSNYWISQIDTSPDFSYVAILEDNKHYINVFNKGNLLGSYYTEVPVMMQISSNGSYIVSASGGWNTKSYKISLFEKISDFTIKEKWKDIENVTIFDLGTSREFEIYPINITNNFTNSDSTIHFWSLESVSSLGNELQWKIYSPDGILYFNPSFLLDQYYSNNLNSENFYDIHYLDYVVPLEKLVDKPGEWRAEVYVNGIKTANHFFYIPGTISAKLYPIIGLSLGVFPLLGVSFRLFQQRKIQVKHRVALLDNWKTNGLMIGHFITVIWALVLGAFLFLNKYVAGDLNSNMSYGAFLALAIFCYLSINTMQSFFTYRKLSRDNLYISTSLSISLVIFTIFSGAFAPAPIIDATLLSIAIVFIPLSTPNFVSISVVRRHGELLLAKEAKINVTPTFPQELWRYYKDAEYIGGGGFAWVFRATRKDGTKIALKIPSLKDENTGKLFLREISNWSTLEHENIVKFYNANVFPIPLFEMELCECSLGAGKRTIEEAASIIYDVAKGLKYAHELKIVHADIKHSNILIKNGKIKISDWGLSKVKRGGSLSVSALTPEYAAPEQIMGKIDERTDIWQLGVVFYNLTTGKFPFGGEYADVINHVLNDEPRLPSEICPDSSIVDHIVMKCLRKKSEERYQSMNELMKDLEKFVAKDKMIDITGNRVHDETKLNPSKI
ncbi:MAG: protein kinase [Candidatus Methanoperedens sp.]|nr:protein kinase [Candidatus Methanoperedens sp.]